MVRRWDLYTSFGFFSSPSRLSPSFSSSSPSSPLHRPIHLDKSLGWSTTKKTQPATSIRTGRRTNMCSYCRYLTDERSPGEDDDDRYRPVYLQPSRPHRSCHPTLMLRLVGITIFFLMLNMTIVLSQSSQTQQQRDQSSSKILEKNPQGNQRAFVLILGKFNFLFFVASSWCRPYLMMRTMSEAWRLCAELARQREREDNCNDGFSYQCFYWLSKWWILFNLSAGHS